MSSVSASFRTQSQAQAQTQAHPTSPSLIPLSSNSHTGSPYRSHADPWALEYICCDSPHGASSSHSHPHSHGHELAQSSPALTPLSTSTPPIAPSLAHSNAGPAEAPAPPVSGRAASAHTGLAARKAKRPRPHALSGSISAKHQGTRGSGTGPTGHRRSQSHIDVPLTISTATSPSGSPIKGHANQAPRAKGVHSTPASAGSSPSAFVSGFVPFSLPLPALPQTGIDRATGAVGKGGQGHDEGDSSGNRGAGEERCDEGEGCCVDPECRDAGVSGGGVEIPVPSRTHAQSTSTHDQRENDPMGTSMAHSLELGSEGDELVKWACSDEGCAAIQKYLESCTQPDCHLPAIPLAEPDAYKDAGLGGSSSGVGGAGLGVLEQAVNGLCGHAAGSTTDQALSTMGSGGVPISPIEQEQRFYQSHVDNNNNNHNDDNYRNSHPNRGNAATAQHAHSHTGATAYPQTRATVSNNNQTQMQVQMQMQMPPPQQQHMPHFHLSHAAPADLSLDMMDIQHLLMHAQYGSVHQAHGLGQGQGQSNTQQQMQGHLPHTQQNQHHQQQQQYQQQHRAHHHHHHHRQNAQASARPITQPAPGPTSIAQPSAVHSCGNPNCTAHLGMAATTPVMQGSSPFAVPTPPGQATLSGGSASTTAGAGPGVGSGPVTGAGAGGTMTSGQLSSITPNGNPAAQLMREYQRQNSLQQQQQHGGVAESVTGARNQMHHLQHSRHHTHHAKPSSAIFPSLGHGTAGTAARKDATSQSSSGTTSANLAANNRMAHSHSHSSGHGYNSFVSQTSIGSSWQNPPSFSTSLSPADSTTQPYTAEGTPFQLSPASLHSQSQISSDLSAQLTKELEMALGNGADSGPRNGMGGGGGIGMNGYGNSEKGEYKVDYNTVTVPSPMLSSTRNDSLSLAGPMSLLNTETIPSDPSTAQINMSTPNQTNGQAVSTGFQPHPTHICHWLNCHMAFASMPDLLAHVASDHLGAGLGPAGGAISSGSSGMDVGNTGMSGSLSSDIWLGSAQSTQTANANAPASLTVSNQSFGLLSSNVLGQNGTTGPDQDQQQQQFAFNAETDRLLSCLWDDCNPMPQECSAEEPGMCPPHPVAAANCNVGVENACCDSTGDNSASASATAFGVAGGTEASAQQDAVNAFQAFLTSQASTSGANHHSRRSDANQVQLHNCDNQHHHHPHQHQHHHSHTHQHAHPHTHTDHSTGEPFSPQTMLRHVLEEHLGVPGDILGWDASSFAAGLGLGPPPQGQIAGTQIGIAGVPDAGSLSTQPPGGLDEILCGPTLSAAHARLHASSNTDAPTAPDLTCHWPDCPYVEPFANPAALMEHLSDMHVGRGENSYVCKWGDCGSQNDGTGRVFRSRQKVLRHLQSHTGHKPFICPECEQAFSEMAPLQAHLRRHKEEKPFVCEHEGCGKRFAIAGSLTIHMRTHNGEKPFVCPHCGKGFVEASNLTKHIRTHTGERPFACPHPGCGKCFPRPDQLKRHMAIHERNKLKSKVGGAEGGSKGGKKGEGKSKEESSESGSG